MKVLLFILLLISSLNSISQTYNSILRGKVIDTKLNPLPFVSIYAVGSNPTITDSYGFFTVYFTSEIKPGDRVNISYQKFGFSVLDERDLVLTTMNATEKSIVTIILKSNSTNNSNVQRDTLLKSIKNLAPNFDTIQNNFNRLNAILDSIRISLKDEILNDQEMYQKGVEAFNDGYFSIAEQWWRKSAKLNNADAQCNLGTLFLNGDGVVRNCDEAIKWLTLSCQSNHSQAQSNLGAIYVNGCGLNRKNYFKADSLFRLSAVQGNSSAQNNLGIMYRDGLIGQKKNYDEAVKWFKLSAEQNYPPALYNLGTAYLNGWGSLDKDKSLANEYITKSANLGYKKAIEFIQK